MMAFAGPGPTALALRVVKFGALLLAVYLVVLFVAANLQLQHLPTISNVPSHRSCLGTTADMLRDIPERGEVVDLLFLGSSHAYRGLDPRFFDTKGLSSFNLGTSAQTPLNTFYLLQEYLARFRVRRAAIIDVYPEMMGRPGAEPAIDIAMSRPLSLSVLRMSLATRSIRAFNTLMVRAVDLRSPPRDSMPVCLGPHDVYVGQGYVQSKKGPTDVMQPTYTIRMRDAQTAYLGKAIDMLQQSGADVVLVVQPVPVATVEATLNYQAVSESLGQLAEEAGALYLDFNSAPYRMAGSDYFDGEHLAQRSVVRYDQRLWEILASRGLVSERSRP